MRVVQALHWLRDSMGQRDDDQTLTRRLNGSSPRTDTGSASS